MGLQGPVRLRGLPRRRPFFKERHYVIRTKFDRGLELTILLRNHDVSIRVEHRKAWNAMIEDYSKLRGEIVVVFTLISRIDMHDDVIRRKQRGKLFRVESAV